MDTIISLLVLFINSQTALMGDTFLSSQPTFMMELDDVSENYYDAMEKYEKATGYKLRPLNIVLATNVAQRLTENGQSFQPDEIVGLLEEELNRLDEALTDLVKYLDAINTFVQ